MAGFDIVHDEERQRFTALVDGHEAFLTYAGGGPVFDLCQTWVPPELRGRGVASALTLAAADFFKKTGRKVLASCSYCDAWFRRHPEYADLLQE